MPPVTAGLRISCYAELTVSPVTVAATIASIHSAHQVSISLVMHGLWWTIYRSQGQRRANLHKRGLARSSSCDCGQQQTINHTVDTCALTVWRWTESTPRSGWWCSHKAGIYCDCSTRKILIIILHPATSTERWMIIHGLLLHAQHARHQWVESLTQLVRYLSTNWRLQYWLSDTGWGRLAQRITFCQEQELDLENDVSLTVAQPPGTLFLPTSTTLLTPVNSENDSRVYFMIVLTTNYNWFSWGPIYKISYDNLTIMPKLQLTYDRRLIYKTSYERRKGISQIQLLQPFNGLFCRTTWVRWYQKGKTNLDFTGARDSEN